MGQGLPTPGPRPSPELPLGDAEASTKWVAQRGRKGRPLARDFQRNFLDEYIWLAAPPLPGLHQDCPALVLGSSKSGEGGGLQLRDQLGQLDVGLCPPPPGDLRLFQSPGAIAQKASPRWRR